ncbi:MAG: methyltransferase domain-containing protein [Solirubrobacteraceae bacterium]|nr:methyltransferase domain-containing protein [Solirubrobacteraceae bacterium]
MTTSSASSRPRPRPAEIPLVARKRVARLWHPAHLVDLWRRREAVRFVRDWLGDLEGVEVGGSSNNDFGLRVVNVDRYPTDDTVYKRHERDLEGWVREVDIVATGDTLPFTDDSHDFVFASHVLEHIPDPIAALEDWRRVARRWVVVVLPHRDRTFDRDRDLTSVEELLERHRTNFASDEDKHWSVWTCESFLELCAAIGAPVAASRDPDRRNGNGFIVVISAEDQASSTA